MSPLRRTALALILLAAAAACSRERDESPFNSDTGHAADWYTAHRAAYRENSNSCPSCHGQGLRGGISRVSCYSTSVDGASCHPGGPGANHPQGWSAPAVHGTAAKASGGFPACEICHGTGFSGGSSGQSCFPCHGVPAPHPPSPWRGTGGYTHTSTASDNASVCAECHRHATGTAGCFNETLCHGQRGTHPNGWSAPSQHGAAAKAAPGASTGFAYCQVCHGANFAGGSSGQSCFPCHGVNAAHPPRPWDGHQSTNAGNAAACAASGCHKARGVPGCFNNGLCHGREGD